MFVWKVRHGCRYLACVLLEWVQKCKIKTSECAIKKENISTSNKIEVLIYRKCGDKRHKTESCNKTEKNMCVFVSFVTSSRLQTQARSIIQMREEQYSQYVGMLYWVDLKMWPLCSSTCRGQWTVSAPFISNDLFRQLSLQYTCIDNDDSRCLFPSSSTFCVHV